MTPPKIFGIAGCNHDGHILPTGAPGASQGDATFFNINIRQNLARAREIFDVTQSD